MKNYSFVHIEEWIINLEQVTAIRIKEENYVSVSFTDQDEIKLTWEYGKRLIRAMELMGLVYEG